VTESSEDNEAGQQRREQSQTGDVKPVDQLSPHALGCKTKRANNAIKTLAHFHAAAYSIGGTI
jgi:hypothetical protein